MILGQKLLQNGRTAARGIRAHHNGQQVDPRFVYEDDGAPFFGGLFFNSGQRSSFQRWISASLRCLARRMGFSGKDNGTF